jgi:glycine betaine/proline transport system substrate-binding protein
MKPYDFIMTMLYNDKFLKPRQAGLKWVRANPEAYKAWLEGVTTLNGKPAVAVFEAYLK